MIPLVSVIVCTHNPRLDYLTRVLGALRAQSLPVTCWELLLMDNGSEEPLQGRFDVAWHPRARLVRVEQRGKVNALLRGLDEFRGEIVVIVDDDNVLGESYLEKALAISQAWPMIGVWSGSITAEFEEVPPVWAGPYLRYLAIREVKQDQWSNLSGPEHFGFLPWGAGMCVRRVVAVEWGRKVRAQQSTRKFERLGSGCGCEDTDTALTACDMGLGTGLFASLRLTHLIRAERVREPYLLKLLEGQVYSSHVLGAARGRRPMPPSWPRLIWGHVVALRRGSREFRFYRASLRGARAAAKEVATWSGQDDPSNRLIPLRPVGPSSSGPVLL
jgi:glycosyltransferase involved in cell wall biosynthesis